MFQVGYHGISTHLNSFKLKHAITHNQDYTLQHYTLHNPHCYIQPWLHINSIFTLMKWMPLQTEPRVGKCQGELWLEWSSGVRGDEVSCSDILTSVTLNVPIMIFKHWICRAVDTFTLYEAIFAFRLIFRYGKEVVDIFHLQYRLLHAKDLQQLPRVQRKCKKYGMLQTSGFCMSSIRKNNIKTMQCACIQLFLPNDSSPLSASECC